MLFPDAGVKLDVTFGYCLTSMLTTGPEKRVSRATSTNTYSVNPAEVTTKEKTYEKEIR
jgi:hypothetical protein